jgi:hypothetical protein
MASGASPRPGGGAPCYGAHVSPTGACHRCRLRAFWCSAVDAGGDHDAAMDNEQVCFGGRVADRRMRQTAELPE